MARRSPMGGRGSGRIGRVGAVGVAVLALVAAGCSGSDEKDAAPEVRTATTTTVAPPKLTPMPAADLATLRDQVGDGTCDELDTTRCLLPFPSNHFTEADGDAPTGKRVHLPTGQLANAKGGTLDPTEWNRNDGFSPGSPILLNLPGVDPEKSAAAPIGDIGRSVEDDSPTMLLDLDAGGRIPHWVELDSNAPDGQRLTVLRPATSFPEGHRIAVVVGPMADASGAPIPASLGFRAYRDGLKTDLPSVEGRRGAMEEVFAAAAANGFDRSELTAAWDFTVASEENLSGRMLAMRDQAFERLGKAAPKFTVSEVIDTDLPEGIGRRVRGTFQVPSFLTGQGEPGSRLVGATDDRLPSYAGSDLSANFTCQLPAAALSGKGGTTRPVVYGHGLLGSADEAENSQVAKIASTDDMMYCATDWIGMSTGDLGNALKILNDLSLFPSLPDRSQQGILNTLFLARAMTTEQGFGSDPAFRTASGRSIIDTTEAYFDGNSQGGIMGGAATAVSTEWTKAVLGVPGMNYALLLPRSVDFSQYFAVLRGAYPDPVDQQLIYGLLSMLWDRAEANGYAQHMTDHPYDKTPKHQVILDVGFGDHQVATVSAEIEARTIGAAVRAPALAPGRHPDAHPFFGLDQLEKFPTGRSVLVYWDSGSLAPPPGNITPAASPEYHAACDGLTKDQIEADTKCADSHEDPRRAPGTIEQKDAFFRPKGKVTDTCDGEPCTAAHRETLDY